MKVMSITAATDSPPYILLTDMRPSVGRRLRAARASFLSPDIRNLCAVSFHSDRAVGRYVPLAWRSHGPSLRGQSVKVTRITAVT